MLQKNFVPLRPNLARVPAAPQQKASFLPLVCTVLAARF